MCMYVCMYRYEYLRRGNARQQEDTRVERQPGHTARPLLLGGEPSRSEGPRLCPGCLAASPGSIPGAPGVGKILSDGVESPYIFWTDFSPHGSPRKQVNTHIIHLLWYRIHTYIHRNIHTYIYTYIHTFGMKVDR